MYEYQSVLYRGIATVLPAVLLLILCTCCTPVQQQKFPVLPVAKGHVSSLTDQLFIKGDFENALLEYEQTYETALSWEDKIHALYGLACTQLILARNPDQLVEAIDNLQKWDAGKGTASFTENRHLLILALQKQSLLIKENNKSLTARENLKNAVIADQQLKITQMTTTNEQLQIEIKKLQQQIEEIEAIDENVQNKRKPL